MTRVRPCASVLLLMLAAAVGGCGGSGDAPEVAKDAVAVAAQDTSCTVASSRLTPGPTVFRITNGGAKVTEFYLYGPDGRAVGEVENIAPGLSRDLRVDLPSGAYRAVCKPGMVGDGIEQMVTVAGA